MISDVQVLSKLNKLKFFFLEDRKFNLDGFEGVTVKCYMLVGFYLLFKMYRGVKQNNLQ